MPWVLLAARHRPGPIKRGVFFSKGRASGHWEITMSASTLSERGRMPSSCTLVRGRPRRRRASVTTPTVEPHIVLGDVQRQGGPAGTASSPGSEHHIGTCEGPSDLVMVSRQPRPRPRIGTAPHHVMSWPGTDVRVRYRSAWAFVHGNEPDTANSPRIMRLTRSFHRRLRPRPDYGHGEVA